MGALADSAVHVGVQLLIRGKHDRVSTFEKAHERLHEDHLHEALGWVHKAYGLRPLVLEKIVMLVAEPERLERTQVVEKLKWNSEHFRDVLLERLRKHNLVFLLSALSGGFPQQALCVFSEKNDLVVDIKLSEGRESFELVHALGRVEGLVFVFAVKVPNPVSQIVLADLVKKRGAAFVVLVHFD